MSDFIDGVMEETTSEMLELETLQLVLETSGLDQATEMMERLAVATERVCAALAKMGDQKHGGIYISSVGGLTEVDVKPAP